MLSLPSRSSAGWTAAGIR